MTTDELVQREEAMTPVTLAAARRRSKVVVGRAGRHHAFWDPVRLEASSKRELLVAAYAF